MDTTSVGRVMTYLLPRHYQPSRIGKVGAIVRRVSWYSSIVCKAHSYYFIAYGRLLNERGLAKAPVGWMKNQGSEA